MRRRRRPPFDDLCEAIYTLGRAWAAWIGAPVVPPSWAERDDSYRETFAARVRELLDAPTLPPPEAAHAQWMADMQAQGWTLGPYDYTHRQHPDLVPYEALHPLERLKDEVFVRTIEVIRATCPAPRPDGDQLRQP